MQIIAGSNSQALARSIAKRTGYELLETKTDKFPDSELKIQISGNIGKEVIIVQSTSNPVNDNLMELLLLADTAKKAGAINITAIIPYFGYSRQDRSIYKHSPISVSLVIKMMEAAGITKVITLDLHSEQIEGMFNIPVMNLSAASIFLPIHTHHKNTIIVSPDLGGISRACNFSSLFGTDFAIINKSRDLSNECKAEKVMGNVKGRNCIIIDDIIDSGNTICTAAELLMSHGASSVDAYITHGVLPSNAQDKIEKSAINKIYISDSILVPILTNKINILPIDEFISDIIAKN